MDNFAFSRDPNIFLRHRVIELFGVASSLLDNQDAIVDKLEKITMTLNLIIWKIFCHKFSLGVTALAVISDSHVAIHTWPEYEYVHLDIITCSEQADWDKLMDSIQNEFSPKHIKHQNLLY